MSKLIIASPGHVLTDGIICGRRIYIADGADASVFYEITAAQYEEILAKEDMEHE